MEMLVCHFFKFYDIISNEEKNPPALLLLSGTGKTMLMDMFYSCVETPRKKRVHFNGFMLDIHKSQYPAF